MRDDGRLACSITGSGASGGGTELLALMAELERHDSRPGLPKAWGAGELAQEAPAIATIAFLRPVRSACLSKTARQRAASR